MPEWLTSSSLDENALSLTTITVRLVYALILGICVTGIFKLSHGRKQTSSVALATTLVLMSVLICMVSMTIGNSVARAFSLVGALSIVRFRTVVDDTRDTAFVILAVIVGMAAGTGLLMLPLIGLPIVGLAAIAMTYLPENKSLAKPKNLNLLPCKLTIRLGLGRDPAQTLDHAFSKHFREIHLLGVTTARQGAALDLMYAGEFRSDTNATTFVAELNHIEGVMSIDLQMNN
ncbi:DUF4956 domain-containing protein [Planctomicrobium sp. SH527]|uniref:DUF4956 domain-containing protein n=1 Tax=Planctomicrobium sp. SH527 TaxID=3448123 RepID=UPI003F5B4E72